MFLWTAGVLTLLLLLLRVFSPSLSRNGTPVSTASAPGGQDGAGGGSHINKDGDSSDGDGDGDGQGACSGPVAAAAAVAFAPVAAVLPAAPATAAEVGWSAENYAPPRCRSEVTV